MLSIKALLELDHGGIEMMLYKLGLCRIGELLELDHGGIEILQRDLAADIDI